MGDKNLRLFVGIGSPHGDDQAGWFVADHLQRRVNSLGDVLVRRAVVPLDLLDWLDGVDHLHLCDACQSGAAPGKLLRWQWTAAHDRPHDKNASWPFNGLGALRSAGTHDCGLGQTLFLAERLKRLPAEVTVWGIEGRSFEPCESVSDEIQTALSSIVSTVLSELSSPQSTRDLTNRSDCRA
jgi:hydrogenase maturation protease